MALFRNREHAGATLARLLERYAARPDVVVLGLPRGGVPVAAEVARRLGAALDVFLVRKLGVPGREELAMGAVATGGVRVINDVVVRRLGITPAQIAEVVQREEAELVRRERRYGVHGVRLDLRDKDVIVVDDGLATGATMRAAVEALRTLGPARVVVAVPVAAPQSVAWLEEVADEVVVAAAPAAFRGVGQWYDDFTQTTDEEVLEHLRLGRARVRGQGAEHGRHPPFPT